MILYQIISFLLVISVVVIVHEFGHYIIARICGVKVEEFAIGFGKKIFSKRDKNNTEWQIRALPLGGYVKMHGDENPASLNANSESKIDKNDKEAFYNKTLQQKFAIVAAGPLFNYIFAIIIYSCVAFSYGIPYVPNVISEVIKDSPADKAGLKANDIILEVNGKHINNFGNVRAEIVLSTTKDIEIKIGRHDKIQIINITPEIKKEGKSRDKFIGIVAAKTQIQKKSIGKAIKYAVEECYNISSTSLRALGQIITGKRSPRELGGPVKIATVSANAATLGIFALILFTAFISVNLGLMNLLPIPLLDGGHLFFYIIEWITGKQISPKIYRIALNSGMVILGGLMVFTLLNDIFGLIGK